MVIFRSVLAAFVVILRLLLFDLNVCRVSSAPCSINGKTLHAPLSVKEVSALVQPGMSVDELIHVCGMPYDIRGEEGIVEYEYRLSFEYLKESDWIMSSFIVIISNDVVQSWQPYATGRVYPGRL